MFNAMKVKAKQEGRDFCKSTKRITDEHMKKLGVHFIQDLSGVINVKKLQQCVMFYIIYYFCRRGCENIYLMRLHIDHQGKKFVKQDIDELDKNHTADDHEPMNDAKMYENSGKFHQN